MILRKKATPKKLRSIWERNNALEGVFWPLKKRLQTVSELYDRYLLLTPYRYKAFSKSFRSFRDYEKWKKKQRNPWFF